MPRQVLASKRGIADLDQACHITLGCTPSSSSSQWPATEPLADLNSVGQQLSCLKPGSRVHQAESTGTWIPWALLWLILEVLVQCKRPPGQLALDTFCERDVAEYYLLVPILWPCEVITVMSFWEDGLQ